MAASETSAAVGEALRVAWRRCGGWSGILVTSAPTVAFVIANTVWSLAAAIGCAAGTAAATCAYRLTRHEPLGSTLAGLLLVIACGLAATVVGQARGFFLLPTALPAIVVLICVGSLATRRPLTGVLLNRIAGGPTNWRRHRSLLRVYDVTTAVAIAINAVNFGLQVVFYRADRPAVLAIGHAATGPVFATLVAATLVTVRRTLAREASPDLDAPVRSAPCE